jgi:flagellar motor switch protein FliN
VDTREITQAVIKEFAAVISAVLGGDAEVRPIAAESTAVWAIRFTVQGSVAGSGSIALPSADASRLTAKVLGFDEDPPEDAITDNLLETAKQAAGIFNVAQGPGGVRLTIVEPVVTAASAPGCSEWAEITVGDFAVRIATAGTLDVPKTAAPCPVPQPVQAPSRTTTIPANLDLILDIDLPLWVRFGETIMTLQALSKLGPGTTIDLDRAPEDPVDVLVNNTIVARGEVVVVSGNYGVRVTEVVSTTSRIRSIAELN